MELLKNNQKRVHLFRLWIIMLFVIFFHFVTGANSSIRDSASIVSIFRPAAELHFGSDKLRPPLKKHKKRSMSFPPAKKGIRVIVDERTELLSVMQLLFEYPLVGRTDIKYKQEAQQYFSAHKNDSAVLYFLNIAERYLSFARPVNYFYHFSMPGFKKTAGISAYENINYGFGQHSQDSLALFINALKRFYTDTKFHSFYSSHRPFYNDIIAKVKAKTDSVDLVNILEKHYGTEQHSYTLVLSPLFIEAGMSTWIASKDGNDLYSIIGPKLDSKELPDFDIRWIMQYLIVHEFSHPFCNPLIDKNLCKLQKDSCLFPPVKAVMRKEGSKTWRNVLCELLTRANEITLIKEIYGPGDATTVTNEYLKKGYSYLPGLLSIIDKYKADRQRYHTLDDIMPEVIAFFDGEAAKMDSPVH